MNNFDIIEIKERVADGALLLSNSSYEHIKTHYLNGNNTILLKVEDVVAILYRKLENEVEEIMKYFHNAPTRDAIARCISNINADMGRIQELQPNVQLVLISGYSLNGSNKY